MSSVLKYNLEVYIFCYFPILHIYLITFVTSYIADSDYTVLIACDVFC